MRRALLLLASMTALGMPAVAAHAQATPIAMQSASDSYANLIAEAAERFAIPAAWIRAIMRIESRGDKPVRRAGVFWWKKENQQQQCEEGKKLNPGVEPQIAGPAPNQQTECADC